MKEIYSKAKYTIIWLQDLKVPRTSSKLRPIYESIGMEDFYAPLPKGFEGTTMNEYDLCTILDELKKHPIVSLWDKKHMALHMMLFRCIDHVISNEWWERVWTIQESYLPSKAPIIFFQGQCFSFDGLQDAINVVGENRSSPEFHDALSHCVSPSNEISGE